MRATERLLEVIWDFLYGNSDPTDDTEALEAVAELRRRGDTLVRADDLRRVLGEFGRIPDYPQPDLDAALQRLNTALGGVL